MNLDTLREALAAADALSSALANLGTPPGTRAEEILAQAETNTDATRGDLRTLLAQEEGAHLERVRRLP